jgi:hypothetical protein
LCNQEHFTHLKDLRTIHFRCERLCPVDQDEGEEYKSQKEVTYDLQRVANSIFQYLDHHALCPKLKSLAVGAYWEPKQVWNAAGYHVPRDCFIRGYQTDFLNRRTVIAIPVSGYTLQQNEPESDILDLDPDSDRLGGLPGRFKE